MNKFKLSLFLAVQMVILLVIYSMFIVFLSYFFSSVEPLNNFDFINSIAFFGVILIIVSVKSYRKYVSFKLIDIKTIKKTILLSSCFFIIFYISGDINSFANIPYYFYSNQELFIFSIITTIVFEEIVIRGFLQGKIYYIINLKIISIFVVPLLYLIMIFWINNFQVSYLFSVLLFFWLSYLSYLRENYNSILPSFISNSFLYFLAVF